MKKMNRIPITLYGNSNKKEKKCTWRLPCQIFQKLPTSNHPPHARMLECSFHRKNMPKQ